MSMIIPTIEYKAAQKSLLEARENLRKVLWHKKEAASMEVIASHCEAFLDEFQTAKQLEKACHDIRDCL